MCKFVCYQLYLKECNIKHYGKVSTALLRFDSYIYLVISIMHEYLNFFFFGKTYIHYEKITIDSHSFRTGPFSLSIYSLFTFVS